MIMIISWERLWSHPKYHCRLLILLVATLLATRMFTTTIHEVRKPYSLGPAEEAKSAVTIIQTILVMLICRQYQNTLFNTSQQKGLQSRHILTMRCAPHSIMQDAQKLTETNSRLCICRRHNRHTYLLHFIFLSPLASAFLFINFFSAVWLANLTINFSRKDCTSWISAPDGSPSLQMEIQSAFSPAVNQILGYSIFNFWEWD